MVMSLQKTVPIQINLNVLKSHWDSSQRESAKSFLDRRLRILDKDSPDALVGWSGEEYWAKGAGIRMPEELGYVAMVSEGWCSGMEISHYNIWKIELDLIIELIRNQEYGPPQTRITSLYNPEFIDVGTA